MSVQLTSDNLRLDGDRFWHSVGLMPTHLGDGAGRVLLVRKAGTKWFIHAGGEIEQGKSATSALRRELMRRCSSMR